MTETPIQVALLAPLVRMGLPVQPVRAGGPPRETGDRSGRSDTPTHDAHAGGS